MSPCLPATGPEQWTIMLLVVIAVALLAAGVLVIRTARGRLAVALVPLAVLALAVGAPAAPAQAAEQVPDMTIAGGWTYVDDGVNEPRWVSGAADATQLEQIFELDAIYNSGVDFSSVVSIEVVDLTDPALTATVDPTTLHISDVDGSISLTVGAVAEVIAGWGDAVGMTALITMTYPGPCDEPVQTSITYTGTLQFPAPSP